MGSPTTASEINRNADLRALERLLREVRDHLQDVRRSLNDEIRAYPTPIPRCDAQFNHLFEERSRLYRALERFEAPALRTLSRANCIKLLEDFVATPCFVEDAAEEEIRARIRVELSRPTP